MKEELNLKQIIEILLPKWIFILIGSLVVALIANIYSIYIDDIYVAQGSLYISGKVDVATDEEKKDTDLSDLMISQELSRTYGKLLSGKDFFKDVANASGTDLSYEQIQRMTKISNEENTGFLRVSVSSTNPETASLIANTVLKCAPNEIRKFIVSGSANPFEWADTPTKPSSPNVPRNTIIGALVGFVLSILIVFLQNMFDKSIKSAEEIKDIFGLPVLGAVPVIDPYRDDVRSNNQKKETEKEE